MSVIYLLGVTLGLWQPDVFQMIVELEIAHVNIVVAVFIWVMIYPMMIQIDFSSIKDVGKPQRTGVNPSNKLAY